MNQRHINAAGLNRIASADFARILPNVNLSSLVGKRIFLTGGTGFFGYWILSAIAHLNALSPLTRVVALSRNPEVFVKRYSHFADAKWLKLVSGNVCEYQTNLGAFDLVIHGAAATSPEGANSPLTLLEASLAGSLRVAEHARLAGAERILYISSGAAYGARPQQTRPISELDTCSSTPADVTETYAAGKLGLEAIAAALAAQCSIETVVARPFAFIGAGLQPHLVISQLLSMARNADRIVLRGDGSSVRTYLYAADLALWLLVLLVSGKSGETYNVGSNREMRLLEVAQIIRNAIAPGKTIEVLGLEDTNPRQYYVPDITKAQTELGLDVWTGVEEAVRLSASSLNIRLAVP